MNYPVFRPDLLGPRASEVGCRIFTDLIPRAAVVAQLSRPRNLSEQERAAALEVWDALYSAGRVSEAFNRTGTALPPKPESEDLPAGQPIDANEAGRRLGVSGARFRQIRKAEGIEPVGTRSGADLFDPAEVAELALSRRLDKSRVAGPDDENRARKVA